MQPRAIINTPGELPTRISPTYGGGYTVSRPGELPITIRPSYGSSTTTAAQVAAYLYPITKTKPVDKNIMGRGKR